MWFRNLQLFRLSTPFTLTPEALGERLGSDCFTPCTSMDTVSSGWVPPLGRHAQQLVHAAGGCIMLCLRTEEKLIPPGVVRQILEDRVAATEASELRTVYRREKQRMKDAIITDLLPRALSRHFDLYAYLDTRHNLLVIDSTSSSRAEGLVSRLRSSLGRFPCTPVRTRDSLGFTLTRWLGEGIAAPGFRLGEECELKHPDPEGGVVSCRRQDLSSSEVLNHVRNGKRVVRLALEWNDRLTCVLHDDLSIRRLRFTDVVRESAQDTDNDDPVAAFDLDFSLMSLELAEFIPALLTALGGEQPHETAADDTAAGSPGRRAEPAMDVA